MNVKASVKESLTAFRHRPAGTIASRPVADSVRVFIARAAYANTVNNAGNTTDTVYEISDEYKVKIRLIEQFIKQMTGKDIKIQIPEKVITDKGGQIMNPQMTAASAGLSSGIGLVYNKTTVVTQTEQTTFSAIAYLKTEDGREISAQISLRLLKNSTAEENTTIRLGSVKMTDPLVMNNGAESASIFRGKITFDLDADGKPEEISFVGSGSGLLMLDRNGDGFANDGSELFGPVSGNGFDDLSAYDSDKNQWIDENDDIFHRLQVWTKNENGEDRLFALYDKGIGAIYLGNVETPYSLVNAGSIKASIRRTGIFVRENGTAGTLQHVDMVV